MGEWNDLVKDMDIPGHLKYGTDEALKWFIKNGAQLNRDHPNFGAAMAFAKKQTRYGSWGDEKRYS